MVYVVKIFVPDHAARSTSAFSIDASEYAGPQLPPVCLSIIDLGARRFLPGSSILTLPLSL